MRNKLVGQIRKHQKRRRIVWLVCYGIGLVYIGTHFMLGDMGYLSYRKLLGVREGLRAEVAAIQARNSEIRSQIDDLKADPGTIEKMARENLGLSREGELIFSFEKNK